LQFSSLSYNRHMIKIRFFFLQALFLLSPLIYAWFYIPGIGVDLAWIVRYVFPNISWSGFEAVKVHFFLFCVSGAFLSHLVVLLHNKKPAYLSRTFFISLGFVFFWTICSLWLNYGVNIYFAFGNPEKHHGWFFYIALFVLFFLLRSISSRERRLLIHTSFVAFCGVVIYAFFQKIGFDPLAPFYQTRLDANRAFSTLGNPNYLAGFVLMMLPLLHETIFIHKGKNKAFWDIILWIVWGITIYWAGSYLAWIIFVFYIFVIFLSHLVPVKKHRNIFWIYFVFIVVVTGFYFWREYGQDILNMQKMKGFIARWYLWKTGLAAVLYDSWHFLFWYGPDWFLAVSKYFRHSMLSIYEDPAYRIDRSHNVFIDFALHFGVPALAAVLFFSIRHIRHLSHGKKVALLLFVLYFSFNIPVLIHFLLLLQIMTSHEEKKNTTLR